jgi:hypothetical protein
MIDTQSYLQESYLQEDLNLIQEGFGDFVKKNIGDKAKSLVTKLKGVKDIESFKKITAHVPKMDPKRVDEAAKKNIPNYEKKRKFAAKELKNVPAKIKAPLESLVAIAAKDEKQIKSIARQINKTVIDWDRANKNLWVNMLLSIVIAAFFSAAGGTPFVVYMALFLMIDLIFYIFDILFIAKKRSS